MKKLGRLFMIGLIFASQAVIFAPVAEASCSQAKVIIWEHDDYEGDGLQICYGFNISNLANINHTQIGYCEPNSGSNDNWNNCTSSFQFFETSVDTAVCLYYEPGYIGLLWKGTFNGHEIEFGAFDPRNDAASSVKFGASCS